MNIAVIDDCDEDRAQLISAIKKYATDNTFAIQITQYDSGECFLQQSNLSSLDVVFLDIYMGELNGMDVANAIRQKSSECQLIFVSSSSAFAVESYKVNAFYYILKPYTYEEIALVMERIMAKVKKSLRFITVKDGREWRKILLSDILYADYSNHYVQVHTENGVTRCYMKFTEMEELLLAFPEFLNCYRCIVVNMNKIKKVSDLFFLLSNGEYIPINRQQCKEIKSHYSDYIFGLIEEGGINNAH